MTIAFSDVLTIVGLVIVGLGALWAHRMATVGAIQKVEAAMFTNIQRVELKMVDQELRSQEKYASNAALAKTEIGLTKSIEGLRVDVRELRDAIHPLAAELREQRGA